MNIRFAPALSTEIRSSADSAASTTSLVSVLLEVSGGPYGSRNSNKS